MYYFATPTSDTMGRRKKLRRALAQSPMATPTRDEPVAQGPGTLAVAGDEALGDPPYDETLLDRARMQWQFGDWESLGAIEQHSIEHHPERAKLVLLVSTACQQLGDHARARRCVQLARDWGCDPRLISQVMIAGVHNTLACAAALRRDAPTALGHFEGAVTGVAGDLRLARQARAAHELARLGQGQQPDLALLEHAGAPAPGSAGAAPASSQAVVEDTETIIERALSRNPDDPILLIAHAECAMSKFKYDKAISRWQRLAATLGEDMEKPYYDRLHQAYLSIKSFPLGTEEEEQLRGDKDKHQLLNEIHEKLQPTFYLEIGVQTGKSLSLAKCRAVGIDPMPHLSFALNKETKVIESASDEFFSTQAGQALNLPPDFVFIDGMHLFEFVLRDFINVEKYSHPATLVVIDDIFPCHQAQARRERCTRAWTGDVWKLNLALEKYRPDLFVQTFDAHPTGLLMIAGLDAQNKVLVERYKEIAESYAHDEQVPNSVIQRIGSWSSNDSRIDEIINTIISSRESCNSSRNIVADLRAIQTMNT